MPDSSVSQSGDRPIRSIHDFCARCFPKRHARRDCDCPMPADPFRAYMDGEITVEAYVKSLEERTRKGYLGEGSS